MGTRAGDRDALAAAIASDIETLCSFAPDRNPGTQRNRDAAEHVASRLLALGAEVETLAFAVPEWLPGDAWMEADGERWDLQPGPFSRGLAGSGRLLAVSDRGALRDTDARGTVLLLHGGIAREQLLPRDYPWYSKPDDAALLDLLEAASPLAVVAATGKNPMATGAMSPFPLIEDPAFRIPSAYVSEDALPSLLARNGADVSVRIVSETRPSTGSQPIGRIRGRDAGRVLVAAHVDTKPGTPGALDNAGGVATLLAVARLVSPAAPRLTVELLPFNGEDHSLSPGQVAYLETYPDLTDVRLMINVDGAGLAGKRTAWSAYGLDAETRRLVSEATAGLETIVEGPQWPASDHMIFAMRGVPTIALAMEDFADAMRDIIHTPADVPANVDAASLADAAGFIARLILAL